MSDSDDEAENPSGGELTYNEEQRRLKESFKMAEEDGDEDEDLLKPRVKTEKVN